jgi:allophanate hydrolase subunit 2
VAGAVQVPPDGRPVVMLADHPTTGGYPVVAVVAPDDLVVVAQAAPGSTIRFVVVDVAVR